VTVPLAGDTFHIPYLIKRVQHAVRAAVDDALRPLGLSGSQFAVLRWLSQTPDVSGAELARQLSVTAQSMNELIGVLVAHGYIERKPHPTHGRIVRMRLTPSGRKLLTKTTAMVEAVKDKMLSGLSADEQRRFARYLERCAAALEIAEAQEHSA